MASHNATVRPEAECRHVAQTQKLEGTVTSSPHWGEDIGEGSVLAGRSAKDAFGDVSGFVGVSRGVSPSPQPSPRRGEGITVLLGC